ncbi:MAG: EamA family transporter [Treponema sp.]|jgi:transporter family protein|nr:EamA family transporter [Treponema sp.]
MWVIYVAKVGVEIINSTLAAALRTVIVLIMSWIIVFASGRRNDLATIGHKSFLFLTLSGTATGLPWLCYYKALQIGEVPKVASK